MGGHGIAPRSVCLEPYPRHHVGHFYGRYVGVTPEEEAEDFDFEETLREIHMELDDLNAEAVTLAATIKKNFEELGV